MKKILKRITSLLLVFAFCFTSMAAVVSDNDGSAFITKSEFDSLKSNFQAQIDQYNTSIDNKIDGAIAAYLTGLTVMKASQYPLVFQDENVHFMNQAITPQYRVPALYLTLTWTGKSARASNNIKQFGIAVKTYYPGNWSSNETQKKPLVKLCTDVSNNSESNIQKIYWDGCALRYREKFTIGKSIEMNYSDLAFFDQTHSKNLEIYYAFYIRNQGYNSSMNTASIISTSAYPYYYENGWKSAGSTSSYSWDYNVSAMNVSLDPYNNKIKDHLHVITYNNPSWEVYNEQFLNTVSQSSNTGILESTVMNKVNNSTYTSNTGVYIGSAVGTYYANGSMSASLIQSSNKTASIGKLVNTYSSTSIYQFAKNKTISYKNAWDIGNPNMRQGMVPFAVNKDQKVKWQVYFPNVTCLVNNSTATNNSTVEVRVYVSTKPFNAGVDTGDANSFIKFKDANGVEQNFFQTTSRQGTLEWTATTSGPVYVKCIPYWKSGTSYLTSNWDIEMDMNDQFGYVTMYDQT